MDKRTVVFLAVVAAALAVLSGCPSPPAPVPTLGVDVYTFTQTVAGCTEQYIGAEASKPAAGATFQLLKENEQGDLVPWEQIRYESTGDSLQARPVEVIFNDSAAQKAHLESLESLKSLGGGSIVEIGGIYGNLWMPTLFASRVIYTRWTPRPPYTYQYTVGVNYFSVWIWSALLGQIHRPESDYAVPDDGDGAPLAPPFAVFRIFDEVPSWYNIRVTLDGETALGADDYRLSAAACNPPDPTTGSVPEVVGRPEQEARDIIEDHDFVVGAVARQCSDTVGAGRVISQNPVGGRNWPFGAEIDLVVSTGPCPVDQFQLTILVSPPTTGGMTTPAPGVYYYDEGEVVNLSAEPLAGWEFVRFDGPVSNPDRTLAFNTVIMDRDQTVTAVFEAVGGEVALGRLLDVEERTVGRRRGRRGS